MVSKLSLFWVVFTLLLLGFTGVACESGGPGETDNGAGTNAPDVAVDEKGGDEGAADQAEEEGAFIETNGLPNDAPVDPAAEILRGELESLAEDMGIDIAHMTADEKEALYAEFYGPEPEGSRHALIPLAAADQTSWQDWDTWISQANPTTNYGTDVLMYAGYGGGWESVLLKSWSCPAGTVSSAQLYVNRSINTMASGRNFTVQRVLNSWDEYTVTWNTSPFGTGTINETYMLTGTGYDWADATNSVQEVCNSGQTNNGIWFYSSDTTADHMGLVTWEDPGSANYSYLLITYNTTTTTTTTSTTTTTHTTTTTTTTTHTTTTTTPPTTTTTTVVTTTSTTTTTGGGDDDTDDDTTDDDTGDDDADDTSDDDADDDGGMDDDDAADDASDDDAGDDDSGGCCGC